MHLSYQSSQEQLKHVPEISSEAFVGSGGEESLKLLNKLDLSHRQRTRNVGTLRKKSNTCSNEIGVEGLKLEANTSLDATRQHS